MISYIKGILEYKSENTIIVETGGVGYQIYVSAAVLSSMPKLHSPIKVYTFMSVKDDGISLFGFNKMEELELFNKLISVNGIGPKAAIALLGFMSASDIIMAIVSEDAASIAKAPGFGKKTAQRLIIDLKDKFKNADFLESLGASVEVSDMAISADGKGEAIEALLSLGYSRSEAAKAVGTVYNADMDTQSLLKAALKQIIKM